MTAVSAAVDVQVEDDGPCSKVLRIKVPAARVDHEIEETYRNVQKTVSFPGFRPGKAPRKLVEARLGERVMADVLERLVQSAYDQALDSTKLHTVGNPRLKENPTIKPGADLAIAIGVDVRPEFALPKLEDLSVTRPVAEIGDADVDAEVGRLRDARATAKDAGDEPLAEHGIASLHVKLDVEGATVVDVGDVEWQHPAETLGGMSMPGLAAALLGKRKGESAALTVKLAEDFRDEQHRGKDASVTLRVDGVQHVEYPAIDDAFASEMDYDSVDEMRSELRKELGKRAAESAERALDTAIAEALLVAVPIDVPPSLVASETERMLKRYELQLRQQSVPEENISHLVTEARAHAETRVKRDLRLSFVLDKVATERKILVTETEVRHEVAQIASRYERTGAEMEDYMERNNLLPAIRSELRDRKTLAALRTIVKVAEPAAKAEAK